MYVAAVISSARRRSIILRKQRQDNISYLEMQALDISYRHSATWVRWQGTKLQTHLAPRGSSKGCSVSSTHTHTHSLSATRPYFSGSWHRVAGKSVVRWVFCDSFWIKLNTIFDLQCSALLRAQSKRKRWKQRWYINSKQQGPVWDLTVAQLVTKFLSFYGTWRFVTVLAISTFGLHHVSDKPCPQSHTMFFWGTWWP